MCDAYSADLQTRQQFTLEVKRELTIHVYLQISANFKLSRIK